MQFSITQIAVALGMVASVNAGLSVCKGAGKTDCIPIDVDYFVCNNLNSADGRPFISGFTTDGDDCVIYEARGCAGTNAKVDGEGWSKFPINAQSFTC